MQGVAEMGQLLARCSKTVICVCALVCVALAFVSTYYMWSRCGPTGGFTGGSAASVEDLASYQICRRNDHVEDIWAKIPKTVSTGDDDFQLVIITTSSGDCMLAKPSDSAVVHGNIRNHTVLFGTLEVKHDCPGMDKWNTSYLTFAVLSTSQKSLCYMFDKLDVQNFLVSSGSINASSRDSSPFVMSFLLHREDSFTKRKTYIACFFTRCESKSSWMIQIVVQDGSLSKEEDIRMEGSGWRRAGEVRFRFAENDIHFGLTENNGSNVSDDGCWTIQAVIPDWISREDVEEMKMASIDCVVIRNDSEECSSKTYDHTFHLFGTQQPMFRKIYFNQGCLHDDKPTAWSCHHISTTQDLDKAVANISDWETLSENLGVPKPVINRCRLDNIDSGRKRRQCLEAYIDLGNACWETVVQVLADYPFYKKRLAKEIADYYIYGVDYSSVVEKK